jgi:putative selenate reductase
VGGRFVELKTVQIMDRLEIAKPCIDAAEDECYNTEWSTEYTLAQGL